MSNFSQDTFEENYINRLYSIKELKTSMSNYISSGDCPLSKDEIKKMESVLKICDDFVFRGERFLHQINR